MRSYLVFLPVTRDSSKQPHARAAWEYFENQCLQRFGGFTRFDSAIIGAWIAPDSRRCDDTSRVYIVGVMPDDDVHFRELIRIAKCEFDQRAIMILEIGKAELI